VQRQPAQLIHPAPQRVAWEWPRHADLAHSFQGFIRRQPGRTTLATFAVHLAVGVSASGLAATSALTAGLAAPGEMLACLGLGILGSLLPDLDADNSAPVQISFTLASLLFAFSVMFLLSDTFPSVAELLAIWIATYLFFRTLVFRLFTRLTTHRGILHSIPAAVLFGLLTAIVAERLLQLTPFQAWLGGSFVTFGYLVHLLLDELYSVNLFGMRTRRSLGGALKLWSPSSHLASTYLYLACAAAFVAAPAHEEFTRMVSSAETYSRIAERLLPQESWFRPEIPMTRESIESAPSASAR